MRCQRSPRAARRVLDRSAPRPARGRPRWQSTRTARRLCGVQGRKNADPLKSVCPSTARGATVITEHVGALGWIPPPGDARAVEADTFRTDDRVIDHAAFLEGDHARALTQQARPPPFA